MESIVGKQSENIGKQLRTWETPKIILYHPENNRGPLIDNLVHFEEDFNSPTEKWRWGLVVISDQTNS